MSKKRSESSRGVEPPEIDDLKLINGIGPVVEQRLNRVAGIYTYTQLAALSPADIVAAVAGLAGLSAERIKKQDWVGQARKLASKLMSGNTLEVEAPARLVGAPVVSQVEPAALAAEVIVPAPSVAIEPELAARAAEVTEAAPPVATSPGAKEAHFPSPVVAITGMPRLYQIVTGSAGAGTPQNCLPYGQPLDVHLTLDLRDVRVPDYTQFNYRASIYSKSLEGHPRRVVGETNGIIAPSDKITVKVEGIVLPKGTYRLKALVILNPTTSEPTVQSSLVASKESDLLLIF